MKALALATALSVVFACAVCAQDSGKTNGARRGMEAAATPSVDVAAIQKKIEAYTEAIKNDPKNDKYYAARGQNYRHLLKWDQAIADMSKAIELNRSNPLYLEERGCYLVLNNRHKEACKDFEIAVLQKKPRLRLLKAYAETLYHLDDYKNSIKYAREALDTKPDDADSLALLGSSEHMLGMEQDALKHLSRSLELEPNSTSALQARALTYKTLGKHDLAKSDLDLYNKLKRNQHN